MLYIHRDDLFLLDAEVLLEQLLRSLYVFTLEDVDDDEVAILLIHVLCDIFKRAIRILKAMESLHTHANVELHIV